MLTFDDLMKPTKWSWQYRLWNQQSGLGNTVCGTNKVVLAILTSDSHLMRVHQQTNSCPPPDSLPTPEAEHQSGLSSGTRTGDPTGYCMQMSGTQHHFILVERNSRGNVRSVVSYLPQSKLQTKPMYLTCKTTIKKSTPQAMGTLNLPMTMTHPPSWPIRLTRTNIVARTFPQPQDISMYSLCSDHCTHIRIPSSKKVEIKHNLATVNMLGYHMKATLCDVQEAVKILNTLQTNAAVLQENRKRGKASHNVQATNIEDTAKYLSSRALSPSVCLYPDKALSPSMSVYPDKALSYSVFLHPDKALSPSVFLYPDKALSPSVFLYPDRTGVSLERLDKLSVIHVAGTKGKGSTCAYCESLLRHHGYKTGFYSSPHLVAVRERIRINGQPLSQQDFTRHFWPVYNTLHENKEHKGDMPPYFKFLTVMAFNVFLAEEVDVAIVEVGIGGEYDCTNVLRQVNIVGITSLGLDHTSLLGTTVEEIAWQKAGIMKPGAVAFSVDQQPEGALKVLKDRAVEKQCPLLVAPPLDSYDWGQHPLELGVSSQGQLLNASLALQLANTWMLLQSQSESFSPIKPLKNKSRKFVETAQPFSITQRLALGLKLCSWPGRTQVIHKDNLLYFLDGAHTLESMELCSQWFIAASDRASYRSSIKRVLLFNSTGDRQSSKLFSPLLDCDFHYVLFCPNIVTTQINLASEVCEASKLKYIGETWPLNTSFVPNMFSDQANCRVTEQQMISRCLTNEKTWRQLREERKGPTSSETLLQMSCVFEALTYLTDKSREDTCKYHLLVTGSLHLVGSVLSVIDPELSHQGLATIGDAAPQLSDAVNS
uniref:tetrahydrofolate synthase n=2 Tax=Timema TaxID=61471 RepID=A0A7R9HY91_9NEOP|nr:unnamed protein product [Timema bartmani]